MKGFEDRNVVMDIKNQNQNENQNRTRLKPMKQVKRVKPGSSLLNS
jgi:hypothetical protein